jgi:diguanylate cyclase (GGDEF)-like protein/PAS domain S-box-containing protein
MKNASLQLRSELIKISYENLTISILSSVIIAGVFVLGLWNIADLMYLNIWLFSIVGMSLLRYLNARKFVKEKSKYSVEIWERRFYYGFLSTSVLWAIFPLLFFPKEDLLYQSFVSIMLIGLASGGVSSLGSHKKHVFTFILAILLPLSLMMILEGSFVYMLMAGIVLLYILVLSSVAIRFNKYLVQSIKNKILFDVSQQDLKHSEDSFETIFKNAPVGIFSFDNNFHILEINQNMATMLQVSIEKLRGFDLHQISSDGIKECIEKSLQGEESLFEGSYSSFFAKVELWLSVKTTPAYDAHQNVIGGFGIITDLTDKKADEKKIQYLAYHDELTNLPNRSLLKERLNFLLVSTQRNQIYSALMFIDLDHFKTINDSLGHQIGDEILKKFTKRVSTLIRQNDTLARLGGDEFVLMLSELSLHKFVAINMALRISQKIHEVTKDAYTIEGNLLYVRTSIGVTLIDSSYDNINDILKHADLAMYQAKEDGRNQTCFYEEQMDVSVKKRLRLENDLHSALENSEFELYYQPITDTQSNRTVCAEILLRYCKKDGTIIYPDDFIPIAEESGLIIPIGYWVLKEVCKQISIWQDSNTGVCFLKNIAINISPKQFMQEDFVKQLTFIVSSYKIDFSFIELELTESVFIDHVDLAIEKMQELKKLGFILSMDDFGTGYSSLSFLKNLPFDIIKIDKSFIQNIMIDTKDKKLVETILDICNDLELKVIAEGVETVGQVEFLKDTSCDYYQGYIVSRPVTAKHFEQFIQKIENKLL